MLEKPPLGLFVVGTDTSVGKTYVTCRLAETLRREGRKVGVYKPAESGWEDPDDPRSDAHRLWEAAGRVGTIDEVCPMRLKTPIAPHLAAAAEGRVWDRRLIRSGLSVWKGRCDIVLVEGAGGLLSPLGDDESVIDLAAEFGYPLLLVGADRVGVVNQVRLTIVAAKSLYPRLPIAGVILCRTTDERDPSRESNAAVLQQRIDVPILATIDYRQTDVAWSPKLRELL
ncbi:MAG TPA: dethiobiotin synthase [Planctomycetaceae bacterium]|nr:dethiobiotin synthase [Planctomycetaceae bacterium]HRE99951.1 dethiobiotin synthase [Pirellulaceae bacterium]